MAASTGRRSVCRFFDIFGGVSTLLLRCWLMLTSPSFVPLVAPGETYTDFRCDRKGWRQVVTRRRHGKAFEWHMELFLTSAALLTCNRSQTRDLGVVLFVIFRRGSTTVELIINLKAAKALGLTIPLGFSALLGHRTQISAS
jgi:hypothetical protein